MRNLLLAASVMTLAACGQTTSLEEPVAYESAAEPAAEAPADPAAAPAEEAFEPASGSLPVSTPTDPTGSEEEIPPATE
ncbi:MAG: lipoprotein [Hyphomonadaceae bacterium]